MKKFSFLILLGLVGCGDIRDTDNAAQWDRDASQWKVDLELLSRKHPMAHSDLIASFSEIHAWAPENRGKSEYIATFYSEGRCLFADKDLKDTTRLMAVSGHCSEVNGEFIVKLYRTSCPQMPTINRVSGYLLGTGLDMRVGPEMEHHHLMGGPVHPNPEVAIEADVKWGCIDPSTKEFSERPWIELP